ncbi:S49 family peptidase [Salmonella enterica]|uniref:S49 family peptidase n=1 Tax=Salmonella enterica TaxID=28901 RepID=A0A750BJF6_SALER|nr:S49 family peptidase [Salmonella enterica]EBK3531340.1 S49 family peptidase [Salmonella enterica]EDZ5074601.1 S49 family peptidase [Salmonella enterica]EGS6640596.1 S49 family peptidase [Salmonella enterica]EJJ6653419.1 S49 family peptidase [Salmonella enterica]
MPRNLSHIAAMAFNEPLLLEPAYARVFFCTLGREIGAKSLSVPQQTIHLAPTEMQSEVDDYLAGGKRQARVYQVRDGIAVIPVAGTLVHKMGAMRPFSGMTGYDGIAACLQQAISDPDVKGVLLDIDSPGGQAAGAFDCADMIYRLRQQKTVWALCNDTACSAAMLLAAACERRLVTQTARIGSVGVMMAHTSYAKQLEQDGVDITLIYAGAHKVDGNSVSALPEHVLADFQQRIDAARDLFVGKVVAYTGLSAEVVMSTEAAVYDGQAGIDIGFADEMVNAADAVSVMAAALKVKNQCGGRMPELNAAEAVAQENARVMGIMTSETAKGREALAQALAATPGMTAEQAGKLLAAAPMAQEPLLRDAIMGCDEAKGREKLAETLAGEPGMTAEKAKKILMAAPAATPASAFDQFMAANSPTVATAGTGTPGDPEEMLLASMP